MYKRQAGQDGWQAPTRATSRAWLVGVGERDPYADPVETTVCFYGPMALARGGPRSRISINQLGLNRKELLASRERLLHRLDHILDLLERDGVTPDVAKELWSEIDQYTLASSEFSSCATHFVLLQTDERNLSRP